jgi:PAS domain S-box-containing protein
MENKLSSFISAICDSVKEGAAVIDKISGAIIFCNHSWLSLFGFDSMNECRISDWGQLRKLALLPTDLQQLLQATGENGVFIEQVEFVTKRCQSFWGELTIRNFSDEKSDYYLLLLDQIDSKMEEERQKAWDKQRSDALLEHASMGIIETNEQAEIINVNPFALKLFGYERDQLINQKIELLIPSRFHSKHIKNREDYIGHPRNRPMGVGMDLYAVRKDGTEFPVEVSLSSYHYNGNKNVIAFVSDITIRKKAEDEIRDLNDHLEQTVELRTHELTDVINQLKLSEEELSRSLEKEKELGDLKSKFVSLASHEFRTPLSTVLSSAYLLQKYTTTEEQPKREKHLERIISSVNTLTGILNDFLSVGKIEEGKVNIRRTEFNIEQFVDSTIEEIKNNFHKQQEIQYHHAGASVVYLDSNLLKHILLNLVSNASKFSPEASLIEVISKADKDDVILSVKDHGIGISTEDQEHLMERFFRGANATNIQGTGLGLHIVAKYAELLNGKLECISELKKGTEFKITFKQVANEENLVD